jgi:hypothetical protein
LRSLTFDRASALPEAAGEVECSPFRLLTVGT